MTPKVRTTIRLGPEWASKELQQAGIVAGTLVTVTIEDCRVVVEPADATVQGADVSGIVMSNNVITMQPIRRRPQHQVGKGAFAGRGLLAELERERAADRERERARED